MTTCHLHELIEQLTSNRMNVADAIAHDARIPAALRFSETAARNAMCFHLGEVEELRMFRRIPDLVRLPFSSCWFEMDILRADRFSRLGVLAREIDEETIWVVFARPAGHKGWHLAGWASITETTDDYVSWGIRPKTDELYSAGILDVLRVVSAFLSALNCVNVTKVEHRPEPKIQRAREKRGKLPIFSYWTLELDLTNHPGGEARGRTHASPRLHLRRGHARQYASGKWTWVQPHTVGNKKAGIVHKDYALKKMPSNPSGDKCPA